MPSKSVLLYVSILSQVFYAAAWLAPPPFAPSIKTVGKTQLGGVCRPRKNVVVSLQMSQGEDSKAKDVVLGPGLFAPDIQLGPNADDFVPEEKVISRIQMSNLFSFFDTDSNQKIDLDELVLLSGAIGKQWSKEKALQALWEIDTNKDGFVTFDEFYGWYLSGNMKQLEETAVPQKVSTFLQNFKYSKKDLENLFQLTDENSNEKIEHTEFLELMSTLGHNMTSEKVTEVLSRLSTVSGASEPSVTFPELYAWISAGYDFTSAQAQTSILLQPSEMDKKRVFVRGFPWRAKEGTALKYFSRCGEVQEVQMINWSRDGTPSGRCIVTFKDEESVEKAIALHRNRMGRRWMEVYRVNEGDKEEIHKVDKSLHGALIGIRGKVVQEMQQESGARIFFETEPEDVMIIKGRDFERVKAWAMAKAVIDDNTMEEHPVDISLHGKLIGAKGKLKKIMEEQSGAHIVYRQEQKPRCCIYGSFEARQRAWQLVQGKMWEFQQANEQRFPLDRKYHGTLIGKGSVVVRAMEDETGARIRFSSGKQYNPREDKSYSDEEDAENSDRGCMVVRGTPKQCETAWKYAQIFLKEMPLLLSELRDEDIALGALRSLPLSPDQVWQAAVDEATKKAREALEMHEEKSQRADELEMKRRLGKEGKRQNQHIQGDGGQINPVRMSRQIFATMLMGFWTIGSSQIAAAVERDEVDIEISLCMINEQEVQMGWIHLMRMERLHCMLPVQMVGRAGANVNKGCKYVGQSPLFFATKWAHTNVMKILLDAGANAEQEDRFGRTTLGWATMQPNEKHGPESAAVEKEQIDLSTEVNPSYTREDYGSRSASTSQVLPNSFLDSLKSGVINTALHRA
eukprot:761416-Hanusia_phi.AAC.4